MNTFGEVYKHTPEIYSGESLHLFHAASWHGGILVGLSVPFELSAYVMKKTMGMEPKDVEDSMVNDYWGEIINQIAGEFLKAAKVDGYSFQRIYQGEFTGESFDYNVKNPGFYFRQKVKVAKFQIELIFGANSSFADEFFNIWPYFLKQEGFTTSQKSHS